MNDSPCYENSIISDNECQQFSSVVIAQIDYNVMINIDYDCVLCNKKSKNLLT